jgi:Glycine/D-amino acid oxidases (deaminating)
VRLQWGTEVNCRMAQESLAFWRSAQERLQPRVEFGWRACGYLWLAHSDAVLDNLRANVALQNSLGIPSRIVSPDEAAALVPGLQPETLAGGSWCAEDGYFDRPQAIVEALGARAEIEIADIGTLDDLDADIVSSRRASTLRDSSTRRSSRRSDTSSSASRCASVCSSPSSSPRSGASRRSSSATAACWRATSADRIAAMCAE